MYNAYQKYYSALKNFERLSGECSFWDNISSIDSFVSEFRSITFVLQKSIGKDEEKKKLKGLPTSLDAALDALEADHDYLTAGGVFPEH